MAIKLRVEVPLTQDSDNTHPEPMNVEVYGDTVTMIIDADSAGSREVSISIEDFEAIAQLIRKEHA